MAGGASKRFGSQKIFLELCGFPLFYWPLMSLKAVFGKAYVAYTKRTEKIVAYRNSFEFIPVMTEGRSYPDDVAELLESVGSPLLTLAADAVFLRPEHVFKFASMFSGRSMAAVAKFMGNISYLGLNIVVKGSTTDELVFMDWPGLPLSINTYYDLIIARERAWRDGCFSYLR